MTRTGRTGAPLRARELSARGQGAISVLELVGDGALERVRALARRPTLAPGALDCLKLRGRGDELLDEALVLVQDETRLELHLHGSPALVRRVLEELDAEPWSGPVGSIEERAEALLAAAPSEAAARMLLDQAQGALRKEFETLLEREGADFDTRLLELVRRGHVAERLLRPPRVVLTGPVNAGKSTLFNALVGRTRVLVDEAAGTTRDAVCERARLGAYVVELCDTAGERELDPQAESSEVERAGQRLATELALRADLVLELLPPEHRAPADARRSVSPRRVVRSCADRASAEQARTAGEPTLSALRAPEAARAVVERVLREALELPAEPWQPGAGVPFDSEWVEGLRAASVQRERRQLAPRIRSWLAGEPAAGPH